MLGMTFSTCLTSCLHMQLSSWFPSHSPHTLNHVSICYAPHGYHDILHMLCILSPYAMLLMLGMAFSTCLKSCLHRLFSSWFVWDSPHAWHCVSICYSPHGLHDILHMLEIMSPYAILLIVWVYLSSCLTSCIHMLFSSWFAWHSPHAWHHVSTCYSPHCLSACVLMLCLNLISRTRTNHGQTMRTHSQKA